MFFKGFSKNNTRIRKNFYHENKHAILDAPNIMLNDNKVVQSMIIEIKLQEMKQKIKTWSRMIEH